MFIFDRSDNFFSKMFRNTKNFNDQKFKEKSFITQGKSSTKNIYFIITIKLVFPFSSKIVFKMNMSILH